MTNILLKAFNKYILNQRQITRLTRKIVNREPFDLRYFFIIRQGQREILVEVSIENIRSET